MTADNESIAVAPPKARIYLDARMDAPEIHAMAGRAIGVFSTRSPDKETPNEDAAAILPWNDRACVLAVADGLGGGASGERASAIAIEKLKSAIKSASREESRLRTAIIDAMEEANRAILELGTGAATTLCVVEVDGATIRSYHVGDSSILAVGGRGKIKMQTTPHSPVGYGIEAGLLEPADAHGHEEQHIVSNVLGSPDIRIEIGPEINLARRDTVLLGTDGLFDNFHTHEIAEQIRRGALAAVMQALQSGAAARMRQEDGDSPSHCDDLTFIVMR